MPEFDIKLYDREFFEWHYKNVHLQAVKCMQWYIGQYKPKSIVDFGCGIGSYLEPAWALFLKIKGYDISSEARPLTMHSLWPFIEYRDCTKPIDSGQYDCVISLETAEHLEPSGTDQFIKNLVNATGKTLLFTAAPPGQEGMGHINCRPKEFWIEEFSKHLTYNKELSDEIAAFWGIQGAPWYIVKNLLVFER